MATKAKPKAAPRKPAATSHEEMIRAVNPDNPTWHIEARGRDLAQMLVWLVRQTPTETRDAILRGALAYLAYAAGVDKYPQPLRRKAVAR